ncbi:hypothetical protein CB0940_01055 [Cercospora beticola]|uniref:NTF2-like domain-containing protein n=2 Tax=Cercospora TaxID=29002 RepID=A0A2G5IBD6_CERBT|nr:hypothetical protein CB0940_01055 [Cercospora beticola]XP_044654304.1 uncharacterized protein CKM354_000318600 [Cercospora kikuchii]PIB01844.1 hypothetical protein CB0940_01055 [Cercospora beticola]WPA96480.1 hypothetical protein RHO25_001087 [Cercospora beticola]CAK1355190.1 unnamed protein product [Cercospora beticola]GIZ39817.1 hypothetical protein CKM354_000318600 [Cercospora kikuchii]
MRSSTMLVATASLFAACVFAAPEANRNPHGYGSVKRPSWYPGRSSTCLSDQEAQGVADNFRNLIADYSDALANASLTEDFVDYSDSVIELINNGCPNSPVALGTATFDSRASFEAGQGAQPPIPFEQLNIWHNCDTVTIRWLSKGPGQEPEQVTGIIVLETVNLSNTWLIKTVYSEFNSGAWLVNLGIFKPSNCSA